MHFVGFTIGIYHDARPYKRQICFCSVTNFLVLSNKFFIPNCIFDLTQVELFLSGCIVTIESDLKRNPVSVIGSTIRTDDLP